MTGKEIRDLGAKAVAELRSHGAPHSCALADYIEALNATMDVSTQNAAYVPEPRFAPLTAEPAASAADDANIAN